MRVSLICTDMSTVKTEPCALTLMLGQALDVWEISS